MQVNKDDLERPGVSLTARRIQPQDIVRLTKINAELESAMAQREFLQVSLLNSRFHRIIHEAVANEFLTSSLSRLDSQYQRLSYLCFSKGAHANDLKQHFAKVIADHVELIKSLEKRDETTGGFSVAKVPSTPDNPALAVIDGVKKVLTNVDAQPENVAFFIHGTTVATNALLEGKGAPVALMTTEGFEDVILIGRQSRPKLYDHWGRRPKPLVSRSQCYGLKERTLHTGEIMTPLDESQAAEGIIRVVNANMVRGMRRVSVERGYDPRDFALVPFGGAGPLHGADLAETLSMDRVIIPAHPGIGSAFGMLSADVRHDYVKTHITLAAEADHQQVEGLFAEMEVQARDQLNQEGFGGEAVILGREVDMRYLRQAYELTVPLTEVPFSFEAVAQLVRRFHDMHRRAYGYARDEEPVEIVNLRLVALGKLPGLKLKTRADSARAGHCRTAGFNRGGDPHLRSQQCGRAPAKRDRH